MWKGCNPVTAVSPDAAEASYDVGAAKVPADVNISARADTRLAMAAWLKAASPEQNSEFKGKTCSNVLTDARDAPDVNGARASAECDEPANTWCALETSNLDCTAQESFTEISKTFGTVATDGKHKIRELTYFNTIYNSLKHLAKN